MSVQNGGSANVESLVQTVAADSGGNFSFCPVAPGTYDIVADSESLPSGGPSNATVATGAGAGMQGLIVPLTPQNGGSTGPALAESIFTTTASGTATGDEVTFFPLQPFSGAGGAVQALIPFFAENSPNPNITATTADGTHPVPGHDCTPTCNSGNSPSIKCACFTVAGPDGNPVQGTANTTGTGYIQTGPGGTTPTVMYSVDAIATRQTSSAPACSPSELTSGSFTINSGAKFTGSPGITFNGCD